MMSLLPGIIVLGLAALAAVFLAMSRPSPPGNVAERIAASRVLIFAILVQSVHFTEELVTGFHERVPAIFGQQAMPLSFFIIFNVAWIGIWIVSVPGIRSAHGAAFFAAWFLAIAGMANGILHPLLALVDGRYFPGLFSSPFICAASIWLWIRLQHATRYMPVAG